MLPPGPLLLAALPSAQPPAIVRYETSAHWRAVLAGRLPGAVQAAPPGPTEVVEYPEENLPLDVQVVADGQTPDGRWSQTVRLTIKPGGSLGAVSEAVYGNVLHVDEMFQAALSLDPSLTNPAFVHVGQEVELAVDPTRTFVLQRVDADGQTLVRTFANGVRETIYRKPSSSVVRLVEFPKTPGGETFSFPDPDGRLSVPSGGRIVDLRYRPGDDYAAVVRESAGAATFKAAADVNRQTGWQPTRWPPPAGEARRAVLGPAESYQPDAPKSLPARPADPAAQATFDRLAEERRRVGIYPFQQLNSGIVYKVMVEDPAATARDVARLIYGDDQEYLAIAQKAGFAVPSDPAAARTFNPRLFGTSFFDVAVEYTGEYFPYADEHDAQAEAHVIKLLNGTVIERFDRAQADGHGVWEITRYPNGHRRITYRPNSLMLTLATGIAYVQGIQDVSLDSATREALRRRYAAEFLWDWSFNVPREPGDIPDSFDVQKSGDTQLVVVTIGPSAPLTRVESLLDQIWNRSPLVKVVAVVFLGAIAVVLVGLLTRFAPRPERGR